MRTVVKKKKKYLFWEHNYMIKYFAFGKIPLILTDEEFLELYIMDSYLPSILFLALNF